MQGFPGVPPVATPGQPNGVVPNLTQYPTAPPTGFVPPSIQVVPGPATIAGSPAGPGSPAGVAGVQMAPVAGVSLPGAAGGPHSLPPFPSFPLPQGFPNPFATGPVALGGAPQGPSGPGQSVTGPQGYFPGIGWVGQQGAGGAPPNGVPPMPYAAGGGPPGPYPNGVPPMPYAAGGGPPGPFPGSAPPMAFTGGAPPMGFPGGPPQMTFPGGAQPSGYAGGPPQMPYPFGDPTPQVIAAGLPATTEAPTARPGPFWLHLGWQLLQTPAVREAFGDLFDQLVRGPDRLETVQAAADALASPDLQAAFQQLSTGQLDQSAFTRLFAERLKAAVTH
ncbi:MAG TPA: hypothetical protein VK191_10120 [Symbiobacteriaceae bacterium]|nr:hypothetical protein [Symbiobacteriaceae bacterium]